MACHYLDSCPFPNDKMAAMPITTSFMVDNYCYWDFTKCVIYRTAKEDGIRNGGEWVPDDKICEKILNLLISRGLGW
jgi:hypothetical protein